MARPVALPGSRPRTRQSRIAERAMELHVAADELWESCRGAEYVDLQEAKVARDLATTLITVARRIAKRNDAAALTGDSHGRRPNCGAAA